MRALTRIAAGLAGAAGVVVLAAGPSQAFDPSGSTTSSSQGNSVYNTQVGNCYASSTPSYLGLSCVSANPGAPKSPKEILGDDPMPPLCEPANGEKKQYPDEFYGHWNDNLTDQDMANLGVTNTPDATWVWTRCIADGMDPVKKASTGKLKINLGLEVLGRGQQPKLLTEKQRTMLNYFGASTMIPFPYAGVSPAAYPRVGADIAFFDATGDEVTAGAGWEKLRAKIVRTEVEPLGAGVGGSGIPLTCAGTGYKAQPGDTPTSHPEGCWYKYDKSSADQPDQRYQVQMTTYWEVESSANNGATWQPFNSFSKTQTSMIPVSEIQAIVVR